MNKSFNLQYLINDEKNKNIFVSDFYLKHKQQNKEVKMKKK